MGLGHEYDDTSIMNASYFETPGWVGVANLFRHVVQADIERAIVKLNCAVVQGGP